MLVCAVPAREGGATEVTDGRQVHDSLAAEAPEVLRELVTPRSALFATQADLSWRWPAPKEPTTTPASPPDAPLPQPARR